MLLEIFILLFSLILLLDYLSKKRRIDMLNNVKGPKALPIIGNILSYRGQSPEEIMKFISNCSQQYDRIYRVWVFQRLTVISSDPRDLEIVLSSPQHITKNNLYNLLHVWLGTGLLMSTGKKWHSRRKIITPTFHFKILEHFAEIFDQQSNIMVEKLKDKADGETAFDTFPVMCAMTLDIIAETAMGVKIDAQNNPEFPYVKAIFEVTNISVHRFINIWHRIDWMFRLTAPSVYKRWMNGIEIMHNFTDKIIMERREALQKSLNEGNNLAPVEDEVGQKKRMALLDVLLQSTIDGVPLSNEDIREEVDTFMFLGHDTTTSGISFALYLIARHPEVQKKLYEEICEVLGNDKKRPVSLRDLGELKYLDCVVKESLRLYPAAPMIGRHFEENVQIRDKLFPAGTNFVVGIFVLLRDPEFFPDPNSFKPERFLSSDMDNVHPYAYIPFSAGPRNCIGQKFAILEIKSVISKMIRHFELLPLGPEVRPMMNIVLRSQNGTHIGIRPRV